NHDFEPAITQLDLAEDPAGEPWTPARLQILIERYQGEHERISLDPEARNLRHTYVKVAPDRPFWLVDQVLVDPDGHNDWVAAFEVDLNVSREKRDPVLRLARIGPVAG